MNYHNKKFKVLQSSKNSSIGTELVFHYQQFENIVSCSYADKNILKGELLGLVKEDGRIEMSYQQIDNTYNLRTGTCISTPEILDNGKLLLHEKWQWTSGDKSSGTSTLKEL